MGIADHQSVLIHTAQLQHLNVLCVLPIFFCVAPSPLVRWLVALQWHCCPVIGHFFFFLLLLLLLLQHVGLVVKNI
jgi:hypothetical protein